MAVLCAPFVWHIMETTGKNPSSQHIPDSNHVLRYCKPSSVADEQIRASAFELRSGEEYLSVNWMEYYDKMTIDMQVARIRSDVETALNIKSSGRLARINVGVAREKVGVSVKHLPVSQNFSHAGIYPPTGRNREMELELANMVMPNDIFPAKT